MKPRRLLNREELLARVVDVIDRAGVEDRDELVASLERLTMQATTDWRPRPAMHTAFAVAFIEPVPGPVPGYWDIYGVNAIVRSPVGVFSEATPTITTKGATAVIAAEWSKDSYEDARKSVSAYMERVYPWLPTIRRG